MGGNLKQGFGLNAGGGSGGHTVNTNIANDDLTMTDGSKTTDVVANTITIESGATEILKVDGSTDKLVIGPSGADYSMPVDRGLDGYLLTSDGLGGTAWENRTQSVEIQAYNPDIDTSPNYFYPVAMSNNKFRALCDTDLGNEVITTAISTSAILRGAYYVIPRKCVIKSIKGWGSCNTAHECQIDIVKFTLVDGDDSAVSGASIGSATFTGGSSNTVMKSLIEGTLSSAGMNAGMLLMPMIKMNGTVETENNVLYFNLIIELG